MKLLALGDINLIQSPDTIANADYSMPVNKIEGVFAVTEKTWFLVATNPLLPPVGEYLIHRYIMGANSSGGALMR